MGPRRYCKAVQLIARVMYSPIIVSYERCAGRARFITTMRYSPGVLMKVERCSMFKWGKQLARTTTVGLAAFACAWSVSAQTAPDQLGRTATEAEVEAWNIDVRPDFQGLPKGEGTVAEGEDIWESTCAVCHGSFAESNLFFTPLIGGTTAEDIETGEVASLLSPTQDSRTTIMLVPTVSTLWDYIHRAVPWDSARSLERGGADGGGGQLVAVGGDRVDCRG